MRYGIFVVLVFALIIPPLLANPADDLEKSLTQMISRLEAEMENANHADKSAFAATIDSLIRLRDRNSWPTVKLRDAVNELQKTTWKLAADADGFQQTIRFFSVGPFGRCVGDWQTNSQTIPFTFDWNVEADRIRITYREDFKASGSFQIIDKTFKYSINGNTLTMQRGKNLLQWERVP